MNMEFEIKFKSSKKMEVTVSSGGVTETHDSYYFEKDGYVIILSAANEENYEEVKESAMKDWETTKAMVEYGFGLKNCNAFSVEYFGVEFKCSGSVIFAIVGGIVELILLAGAGLAVFYKVKK